MSKQLKLEHSTSRKKKKKKSLKKKSTPAEGVLLSKQLKLENSTSRKKKKIKKKVPLLKGIYGNKKQISPCQKASNKEATTNNWRNF
jgi:hypothetical protein